MNMRNGAANGWKVADIDAGQGHIFHGANQTNPAAPVSVHNHGTHEPAGEGIWDTLGPTPRVGTDKRRMPDRCALLACAGTKSRGQGIRFRNDAGTWKELSVISRQSSVSGHQFFKLHNSVA